MKFGKCINNETIPAKHLQDLFFILIFADNINTIPNKFVNL